MKSNPHLDEGLDEGEIGDSEASDSDEGSSPFQTRRGTKELCPASGAYSKVHSTGRNLNIADKVPSIEKTYGGNKNVSATNNRKVTALRVVRTRCSSESRAVDLNKYIIQPRRGEDREETAADSIDDAIIAARKRQSSLCTELEYRQNQRRLAEIQPRREGVENFHQNRRIGIQRTENFGATPVSCIANILNEVKSFELSYFDKTRNENEKENTVSQVRQMRNRASVNAISANDFRYEELNKAVDNSTASLSLAHKRADYSNSKSSTQARHSELMYPETIRENISSTNSSRSGRQNSRELFISGTAVSSDSSIRTSREERCNMLHSDIQLNSASKPFENCNRVHGNNRSCDRIRERGNCEYLEDNSSSSETPSNVDRAFSKTDSQSSETPSNVNRAFSKTDYQAARDCGYSHCLTSDSGGPTSRHRSSNTSEQVGHSGNMNKVISNGGTKVGADSAPCIAFTKLRIVNKFTAILTMCGTPKK